MKRKNYVYGLKPYGWFKGSVLTFLGLLLSRWGIGVGRVSWNIYFGLPIYFVIASSAMLIALTLKIEGTVDEKKFLMTNKLTYISATLFTAAFATSIYHTVYYNLEELSIFILASIGIILIVSVVYGKDWDKRGFLSNILISFSISFGIIYGASLNGFLIPTSVFLFFGATFLLQFSKDLINEGKNEDKYKKAEIDTLISIFGEKKALRTSLILDLLVIVLIVFPIILLENFSLILYSIPLLIIIILLGFAAFLTFLMKSERTYYRIVKTLLKISMFFLFTLLFLACF